MSGFAKVVLEWCGFHHWIAQRISWVEVVSVFLYLLQFPSYDAINDVIMSDTDCTLGRGPCSVAASFSPTFWSPRHSVTSWCLHRQCSTASAGAHRSTGWVQDEARLRARSASGGLLGTSTADPSVQAWLGQEYSSCTCTYSPETHKVRSYFVSSSCCTSLHLWLIRLCVSH